MNTSGEISLDLLREHPDNPRKITEEDLQGLMDSIQEDPDYFNARPVIISDRTGELIIIAGNQRFKAARKLDRKTVPYYLMQGLTEEDERRILLKDNGQFGKWDWERFVSGGFDQLPFTDWGVEVDHTFTKGEKEMTFNPLVDRFLVPPFSILDTRQGYWTERKRLWNSIIKDRGETRENTLSNSPSNDYSFYYRDKSKVEKKLGREISNEEFEAVYLGKSAKHKFYRTPTGVSILDPVLAELCLLWFGLPGGSVLDTFAGDTVFGYVAGRLGHTFTGIELRQEQVNVNAARTAELPCRYICDDALNVLQHITPESQDFFFSCPPYFNLEHYSDLPNDASNQGSYEAFIDIMRRALTDAFSCLRQNRFAVVVCSDIRSRENSLYHPFIRDLKTIAAEAGLGMMNELILVEQFRNAGMRAAKQMSSRLCVRVHQHVLVFFKGDTKTISQTYKPIEYDSEYLEQFLVDK